MDDETLLARFLNGDARAFAELHGRYLVRIHDYFWARRASRGDAEDLVQEVFMHVFLRAATFDPQRGRFCPWIFTIAHNCLADFCGRRRREFSGTDEDFANVPDDDPDPTPPIESDLTERIWHLRSCIERLPPAWREPIVLRLQPMLIREVAGVTGDRPGTVGRQLHEARERLLRCMESR